MAKKKTKSKILKPLDVNAAGTIAAVPVQKLETQILDKVGSTGSQGIGSETTFLEGTFYMPEPWDPFHDFADDLREAVITWYLSGRMTTDAAPGTSTVRVKLNSTNIVTDSVAEGAGRSANRLVLWGEVTLGPRDGGTGVLLDANGSILRLSQVGLFTNQIGVEETSTAGISVDYNEMNTLTITMQSTDAGTSIESWHGWMMLNPREPLELRTIF